MQIQVLSVSVSTTPTAKGSYQSAEVAYKGEDGQVKGKKVMSFGAGAVAFKVLSKAQPGETYSVTPVKNDKDFWDWTDVKKMDGTAPITTTQDTTSTARAPAGKVVGSNYETSDERAAKQVFIVRQSSIANAIALRGAKATVDEIIATASLFEKFVFAKEVPVAKPAASFDDFESDIPL